MTQNKYKSSSKYHFPVEHLDDEEWIEKRVKKAKITNRQTEGAFRRLLQFLYIVDYDKPISRPTVKGHVEAGRLTDVEVIMANRLSYRSSNSKAKYRYGMNAVLAVKKGNYKCAECGMRDVRCLEIDHVSGREENKEKNKHTNLYRVEDFQILCANHHRIKTVVEGQTN